MVNLLFTVFFLVFFGFRFATYYLRFYELFISMLYNYTFAIVELMKSGQQKKKKSFSKVSLFRVWTREYEEKEGMKFATKQRISISLRMKPTDTSFKKRDQVKRWNKKDGEKQILFYFFWICITFFLIYKW